MSNAKLLAGATPSQRLDLKEFLKEKARKLDENHTTLMLKHIQLEKDLANTKEQVLMLEGAVMYMRKMLAEWDLYANDTARLRALEEQSRLEQKQAQATTKKTKGKGKNKECQEPQSEQSK